MAKRVGKSRRNEVQPVIVPVMFEDEAPVEPVTASPPESLFDGEPTPPTQIDILPPIERDLTPDQRREFTKLLDTKMGLEERADHLVRLAKMHGNKTAPVGLRAIMEINRLTGLSEDRATEAPAMFNLPEGTSVSVKVEKVEK